MIPLPPKKAIQHAFDRAAHRYDEAASLQKYVCKQLLDGLHLSEDTLDVLDAGCGTGLGSALIAQRYPKAQITQLDLSLAMLNQSVFPKKILGDLEQLPIREHRFDLYWSSLSVQWCNLDQALHEAHRVLKPGGHLAIATLGLDTFQELRHAFAQLDPFNHTLAFLDSQQIHDLSLSRGFKNLKMQVETKISYHPNLTALLHSIKAVGANQISNANPAARKLSRSGFEKLSNAYETMRTPAGLPLRYQVIRVYAHR